MSLEKAHEERKMKIFSEVKNETKKVKFLDDLKKILRSKRESESTSITFRIVKDFIYTIESNDSTNSVIITISIKNKNEVVKKIKKIISAYVPSAKIKYEKEGE